MFERSVTDLIRGIRTNKNNEDKFIQNALLEIQKEVKLDLDIKTNAIQKLCALHTMGFDMSWASFHVIEIMSSPKLAHKKVGYLAAALSFSAETDVIMLCTNLIKKDLASNDITETIMALHTLAQIVTPDLARDLYMDVLAMLNHSHAYIRKRALLVLYSIFLQYPQALSVSFPRLKEKLEDENSGVICTAVTVICELAKRNPKAYLPLAPQLFSLLTSGSNNWMLIKIIKLFASLTPFEPRLIKKLTNPIIKVIENTRAMSVVYECIQTLIVGGIIEADQSEDDSLARLCVSKLKIFLEQSDQNLKYLGLFALGKLLKVRPKAVAEHRDIILKCLEDGDVSIRMRSVELISGLVNNKTLFGIVKRLLVHLSGYDSTNLLSDEVEYRSLVAKTIIAACSNDLYKHLDNFEWYIEVLIDLTHFPGLNVGHLVRDQLIDLCVRVKDIRSFSIQKLIPLLSDTKVIASVNQPYNMCQVLEAAAWICGEYFNEEIETQLLLETLLSSNISVLPSSVQVVFLFSFFKIFTKFPKTVTTIQLEAHMMQLDIFIKSPDIEVQDRASLVKEFVNDHFQQLEKLHTPVDKNNPWFEEGEKNGYPWSYPAMQSIFTGELNVVAQRAQENIQVPDDLDLNTWLLEPTVNEFKNLFKNVLHLEQSNQQSNSNVSNVFLMIGNRK
ncbi:Clathrin/coatomer adaptor, adaptin-like protein [Globomyces pollinis-pini]|nr:Clathrin/coatomer adaptor, adaptin-like protein [Globomyces pollinis-pini]